MADISKYLPILKQFEGGYADNPNDPGGCTNMGITLTEFQHYYGADKTVEDLQDITPEQWAEVVKKEYWDAVQGDLINDQQVANSICDFAYNSGIGTAVSKVQAIVGITPTTGFFGNITLDRVNKADAGTLCNAIADAREEYDREIIQARPKMSVFMDGWLNRINALRYKILA